MRSLATDIRNGMKHTKYKIKVLLWDGKGGNCAMGVAILGTGVKHDKGVPTGRQLSYMHLWPKQDTIGISGIMVGLNNGTDMPISEIADKVEQMEWEHLGIPTLAMREELAASESKPAEKVAVK